MSIRSMPNNKLYDDHYDQVFGKKEKPCGCEDTVAYSVKVKHTSGDPPYLATCDEFPDMQVRASEPHEAFEKAEQWIANLLGEV